MDKDIERFISYAKIDTQSDDESPTSPSSSKQLNLARKLVEDCENLGIKTELDEYGIVWGKLPGKEGLPTIGLNAHMDTALEVSGANVNPQIHENYDGSPIKLNEKYTLDPADFPYLSRAKGHTIITTDGNTLLGGDDKAGLTIIMAVLSYYKEHPEVEHHPLSFCFTPDEEIGRGPEHFDAAKFGADYAYTVDGGAYDEFEMETFNAAHATVKITGNSIHPGSAKGKMINATTLGIEFDRLLPEFKRPEYTSGHEGFNHCVGFEGATENATLYYILRNHSLKELEIQKKEFANARDALLKKYPKAKIELEIGDDYRNMKEILDKDPRPVDKALKAYKELRIDVRIEPIRGGTDGATFSFKGCPTPNLGTGTYNMHGRFEYLDVDELKMMIELVKAITKA